MMCKSLVSLIFVSCLAVAWLATEAAARPAGFSENHNSDSLRPRRGFKNAGLATARGFGKRASWSAPTPMDDDPESLAGLTWLSQLLQRHPELSRALELYDAEAAPDSAKFPSNINEWSYKE